MVCPICGEAKITIQIRRVNMFPDACERCGLETDELMEYSKDNIVNWFLCSRCAGSLYHHEFYPHPTYKELCVDCGKTLDHDNHT